MNDRDTIVEELGNIEVMPEEEQKRIAAQAITQLKADAQEIERLRSLAYDDGDTHFSWKELAQQLQKQNAELREGLEKAHKALEPFARQAPHIKELYATEAWMAKKADFFKAWDTWDKIRQLLTPQPNLPGDVIQPKKEECRVCTACNDPDCDENPMGGSNGRLS